MCLFSFTFRVVAIKPWLATLLWLVALYWKCYQPPCIEYSYRRDKYPSEPRYPWLCCKAELAFKGTAALVKLPCKYNANTMHRQCKYNASDFANTMQIQCKLICIVFALYLQSHLHCICIADALYLHCICMAILPVQLCLWRLTPLCSRAKGTWVRKGICRAYSCIRYKVAGNTFNIKLLTITV